MGSLGVFSGATKLQSPSKYGCFPKLGSLFVGVFLIGSLIGGSWGLVTTYRWASNPTYSLPNRRLLTTGRMTLLKVSLPNGRHRLPAGYVEL